MRGFYQLADGTLYGRLVTVNVVQHALALLRRQDLQRGISCPEVRAPVFFARGSVGVRRQIDVEVVVDGLIHRTRRGLAE